MLPRKLGNWWENAGSSQSATLFFICSWINFKCSSTAIAARGSECILYIMGPELLCFFSSVFLWICCSVRFPGNLQHFGVGLGCIYTMHLGVYLGLRSKKAETSGEAEAEKQRSRKARSREAEKQRKHKSKCREKQKSRKTKSREAEKQRSRETHIQKNVQHGTT